MNQELIDYVASRLRVVSEDYEDEESERHRLAFIAVKAVADWTMRALGIAEGPQGPMGYPGPQGLSGIAHIVIVDKDGHRMMTRAEYEHTFGPIRDDKNPS